MMASYDSLKRFLDIAVAGPALVITAPLQVAIAVAVKKNLGSPVLFTQARPGLGGKPFTLLKFRSMRNPKYPGEPDRDRMTPFGSFLRSTSMDELPSLINVLRGDMSVVGPRPLLMEYLELYTAEQARRHEVRPGITGLAQVSGRNATSWENRLAQDVEYVENRSLRLDLEIIILTLRTVVRRDGIAAEGSATMPRFTGSNPTIGRGDER